MRDFVSIMLICAREVLIYLMPLIVVWTIISLELRASAADFAWETAGAASARQRKPRSDRYYGIAGWMNVHGVDSESFGTSTAMR